MSRPRFKITSRDVLPTAEFASRDALLNHVRDALAAQALIDQLNRDGDVAAFTIDMQALGLFNGCEIGVAARTRVLPGTLYI